MDFKSRWDWWSKQVSKSKAPFFGTGPRIILAITFFILGMDMLLNGASGRFWFGDAGKIRYLNPTFLLIGWFIFSAIFVFQALIPSEEDKVYRRTKKSFTVDVIFYVVFGTVLLLVILKSYFLNVIT